MSVSCASRRALSYACGAQRRHFRIASEEISWLARDDGRRRQSGHLGETCGEGAGESAEEGYDLADLGVRQGHTQLNTTHHLDGVVERRHRPIVEVWRRHGDVPETRHLENIEVGGVFGEPEAPLVDVLTPGRLPVLFHEPEFPEYLSTDPHPVVAGGTATAHELFEARPG